MSEPGNVSQDRGEPGRVAQVGVGVVVVLLAGVCGGVALLLHGAGTLRDRPPPAPAVSGAPALETDPRAARLAIERAARARLAGEGGAMAIDEALRRTAAAGWDAPR